MSSRVEYFNTVATLLQVATALPVFNYLERVPNQVRSPHLTLFLVDDSPVGGYGGESAAQMRFQLDVWMPESAGKSMGDAEDAFEQARTALEAARYTRLDTGSSRVQGEWHRVTSDWTSLR